MIFHFPGYPRKSGKHFGCQKVTSFLLNFLTLETNLNYLMDSGQKKHFDEKMFWPLKKIFWAVIRKSFLEYFSTRVFLVIFKQHYKPCNLRKFQLVMSILKTSWGSILTYPQPPARRIGLRYLCCYISM